MTTDLTDKMPQHGTIIKYDDEFNGVLVDDRNVEVSIPGALVGEEIRYHVEHVSPHAPRAWGACDSLLKPSINRISPACELSWPVAGPCPGCPLMHIIDRHQNELKKTFVENALKKAGIAYIHDVTFNPAPETFHYRNRSDFVVAESRGKLIFGAYRNRSHNIFSIPTCPVLRAPINQVLLFIRNLANRYHIPAAKSFEQSDGALRYVSIFANDNREVLVDFVCKSANGKMPSWLRCFALELREFPPIRGVSYSLNDSPNNAIRIAPSETIWGESRLVEHHGPIKTLYSASGFTQLNTDVAAKIYATAKNWLLSKPRVLWDLYCGAGAFGRSIAPQQLFGAEFSPSAIDAARKVSETDDFKSTFEVMDLEKQWPNWPNPDVILVDPPRKGLSQTVLANLHQTRPPTIVYMSCNAETFAQNVAALGDLYVLTRIEAFDMMPQTRQIEVLGMLRLR